MKTTILFLVIMVTAGRVMATPVIGNGLAWGQGVTAGETAPGSDPDPLTISTGTGGAGNSFITFSGGPSPAVRLGDTGTAYTGSFISVHPNDLMVNFTLTPLTAVAPYGYLNLYFKNGAEVWRSHQTINLSGMAVNMPGTFRMFIGNESAWEYFGDPLNANFVNDYAHVSEFGFELIGANTAPYQNQTYAFDNVYFSVPEPETVWMILVVLASLGMTFRVRLTELAGQLKERIKA